MISLGLIGFPLGHSFSASYFNNKFRRGGIAGEYRLYPLESAENFPDFLSLHSGLCGLNVTIPHKESIMPFLDSLSEEAAAIGAVNVISIRRDIQGNTRLTGHNTDWSAFRDSLAPLLGQEKRKALVLGTGGASKAVTYALRSLDTDVTFVSRTPGNGIIGYEDLTAGLICGHKIIVNTTPVGMHPSTEFCPPIPYDALTPDHICYDLIYNPEVTLFMKKSAEKGAVVKNGLEMLHRQAESAWEIWKQDLGMP